MPQLLLADTFFASLGSLSPGDSHAAMQFVRSFHVQPVTYGNRLHRLNGSSASGLWSARVNDGLRAIVHRRGELAVLLHVGQHDAAYKWAERRRFDSDPATGAMRVVAVDEVEEVHEKIVTRAVHRDPLRFNHHDDAYLQSLGVPDEWLPTVKTARTDDDVLTICERLADSALAERLLKLAQGELVTPPPRVEAPDSVSADARRHFYVVGDADELVRVLNAPLDAWMAFLHPAQRALVERDFNGPAKVTGSAGTGKTVVAMHRARRLAREGKRVFVTSFVTTLCDNIARNLDRLCAPDERAQITVATIHKTAWDLVRQVDSRVAVADKTEIRAVLEDLRVRAECPRDASFVRAEFEHVIQRQGIGSWHEYRQARRAGRGRGVNVRERKALWDIFSGVYAQLGRAGKTDWPSLCRRAAELVASGEVASPYDAVLVDEVQDLQPADLRLVVALASAHPEHLMVVGDAGQRIHPSGFSLRALGVDVVGRSTILRVNYRTTEQIRRAADNVASGQVDDLDGGSEPRGGATSLLRGPAPTLHGHAERAEELAFACGQVASWRASGLELHEIAVFARTKARLAGLERALAERGIPSARLSDARRAPQDGVRLGTMHRAKGLEFKAVLVFATDGLPNAKAVEGLDDPQDLEDATTRERNLLYVAMTRARDRLAVSWTGAPSPFVEGLLDAATAGE